MRLQDLYSMYVDLLYYDRGSAEPVIKIETIKEIINIFNQSVTSWSIRPAAMLTMAECF